MNDSCRLILRNVSRRFRNHDVLHNVSLDIRGREVIVILGTSGVGKTTLMNIAAGLDTPISGKRTLKANTRLSYMLQEESLFPWRNAYQNAIFGCEVQGGAAEYRFVDALLKRMNLADAKEQMPPELSGGMKQRISFIRTIAPRPDILLLDEPFSSVDFDMKLEMQRIILSYVAESGASVVLVTHDFDDAAALGKTLFVLRAGQIERIYTRDDWDRQLTDAQNIDAWRRSENHLRLVNQIATKVGPHNE